MRRFKSILVVVDEKTENRAVVERAVILAQRNQARLTLVSAVRAMPRQMPTPTTSESPADAQEPSVDIIEEWPPHAGPPATTDVPTALQKLTGESPGGAETPVTEATVAIREQIVEIEGQRLEQRVDFVRGHGVPVDGRVLYGTPFLEIIREVLRNKHDLVMITARGRRGLRRWSFGSTAMHLMRKCPCPVWVVRSSQPERYTRILAAVDPGSPEEEPRRVAVKIMDLATALAQRDQCELIIVHTWSFPAERALRSGYSVATSELEAWVRQAQALHRRRLAEFLAPYPLQDLKSQVYMLQGKPGRLIPELAAKLEAGLIVMGTVSRTGVAGLLIGNTAERILRQVNSSVLTVKPDGFVTPVKLEE